MTVTTYEEILEVLNKYKKKDEEKNMTLEILQKEMVKAMKEGNKLRKETISSMISAIKKAAIDAKCKENITEEFINQAILKEKKTMQEMIDTCPSTRLDILQEYQNKMEIINEFAPKMMNEDEIRQAVGEILSTGTATNMGMAMKEVMAVLKGKADGKVINKIVREIYK